MDFLQSVDWVQLGVIMGLVVALVKAFYQPPGDKALTKVEISQKYQDMLSTAADDRRKLRAEFNQEIDKLEKRLEAVENELAIYKIWTTKLINQLLDNEIEPHPKPERPEVVK